MPTPLEFGSQLTVIGIISVFAVMASIIVLSMILKWIFKDKELKARTPEDLAIEPAVEVGLDEVTAATVAIAAYTHSEGTTQPRKLGGRGVIWKTVGRMELMKTQGDEY